ncbi:hypothetical protein EJB05_10035 [Eragrostis curvula]|uniref:Uncharacterized protein n=1 Tax=Eragrostis curvula TaxID=38414 RepID=A0A5J9W6G2_9POAL|nr:hypothetical protein EJB05_10035 [Eragrostis curvula]
MDPGAGTGVLESGAGAVAKEMAVRSLGRTAPRSAASSATYRNSFSARFFRFGQNVFHYDTSCTDLAEVEMAGCHKP